MLRIRFETFCTTPVISRSAPSCLCQFHVTAAASLQIALMRRSIDRRDIDDLELAGLAQFLAHLIADPHQPVMFVGLRCRRISPSKAGVDHLEIEHRKLGRFGRVRGTRLASIDSEKATRALMIVTCRQSAIEHANDKKWTCKLGQFGLVSRQSPLPRPGGKETAMIR